MSTYIKDFDWEEYNNDEESLEKFYEDLEESDKNKNRKKQIKMRSYEGYYEEG